MPVKPLENAVEGAHKALARSPVRRLPGLRGLPSVAQAVLERVRRHRTTLLASGAAFYVLLSLFPAALAATALYGLTTTPTEAAAQAARLVEAVPGPTGALLEEQVAGLAQRAAAGLGFSFVVSILLAIWGAGRGAQAMIVAVNLAVGQPETRNYVHLRLMALALTASGFATAALGLTLLFWVPRWLADANAGGLAVIAVDVLRWVLLVAVVLVSVSILYHWAPDHRPPHFRLLTVGSVAATVAVVGLTAGLAVYLGSGRAGSAIGVLAAATVALLWLVACTAAVLIGAEIDSELLPPGAEST